MADVVLFGIGRIAQVAHFYLQWEGRHRIVAFTVDRAWKNVDEFEGKPVIAWEELEHHYTPQQVQLFAPLSYRKLNAVRMEKYLEGRARGYSFISFIHPSTQYYGTPVGDNCFILENCTIQPFTEIGNNVVLWARCHIGHHAQIGDHSFLTVATIAGGVAIGERCFISAASIGGSGERLTVGDACVVFAGAVVNQNLPAQSVVNSLSTEPSRVPSSRLRNLL